MIIYVMTSSLNLLTRFMNNNCVMNKGGVAAKCTYTVNKPQAARTVVCEPWTAKLLKVRCSSHCSTFYVGYVSPVGA